MDVGIEETEQSAFTLYPNPARDYLTITTPQTKIESFVTMYNVNGREMLKKQISGNVTKIDIRSFANGVYIVKLIQGNAVEVRKIVKK
jgi:hypothetical protein